MIELDGAEGGGQIVRSALSLSALAGEPFRIENVRGARDDPGLKHQHHAAVELVAEVCDADVEGAELDAETLTFDPGQPSGGQYEVDVGTAGSVTLVFDAVLPLAVTIDEPLAVTISGGTDVEWSPPIDYYRRVKLPVLRRHAVDAAVDVERRGFYPAGGGVATLTVDPSDPAPIDLTDRGERHGVRLYSVASEELTDADVAERQ
ncbi:RNA 3'-terminal phosphate cyclase, partial [Natronoarchaeum mannanilyticum]|uniref:RNA 3'-terminal phosphate cyclase n=1 Tax=Natronoarchaeum mannanilyticum TaxID=926360 RepID=UPI00361184E9